MTKAQQKRRIEIIHQLSALSREGWWQAKPYDYKPLERELRQITGGGENG